jgi:hypothetical protein
MQLRTKPSASALWELGPSAEVRSVFSITAQMALVAGAGEPTTGCCHIQNVDACQSRLKLWMVRLQGAASK